MFSTYCNISSADEQGGRPHCFLTTLLTCSGYAWIAIL